MMDQRKELLFGHYPERILNPFKQYHLENPHIFKRFKELSFQMKNTNKKRYGARTIIEVIRWESDLSGNDEFKINNNYNALYARLLIYHYPEFENFFEIRDYDFEKGKAAKPPERRA